MMNDRIPATLQAGRIAFAVTVALILTACASQTVSNSQTVEVRVETEDPSWAAPLQCYANNAIGSWQFVAPGKVTVQTSVSPLQIVCNAPAGASNNASTTVPSKHDDSQERSQKGAATGAKVGAGMALGVASAPVMGPAFAIMIAAGSIAKGAEVGGVIGSLTSKGATHYPSPIIIRIIRSSQPNQ